jgi:hypothetical protein
MAEPLLRLGCGGIRGCEIDQKWGQFEYTSPWPRGASLNLWGAVVGMVGMGGNADTCPQFTSGSSALGMVAGVAMVLGGGALAGGGG